MRHVDLAAELELAERERAQHPLRASVSDRQDVADRPRKLDLSN
jgi:hypothetical protein